MKAAMHRTESPLIAVAICLAALAGFVDALAFTSFGGFFASFMSGNSTRLGTTLGTGPGGDALMAAALILSFVSGVIVASVIGRALPDRRIPAVMAAVTALLWCAAMVAWLAPGSLVLLLLAAAMGAAHLVLHLEAHGSAYPTGSLVRLGELLAGALMGDRDRWGWLGPLLLWAGFAAGAVLGAGAHARWGAAAYWLAVLGAAGLTLWFGLAPRRQTGSGPKSQP